MRLKLLHYVYQSNFCGKQTLRGLRLPQYQKPSKKKKWH